MRLTHGVALVAAALIGSGQAVRAQDSLVIRGHVVRQAVARMVPVSGVVVTLHRIGPTSAGAIDSLRTDRSGEFSFRIAADSSSMYLATSRHGGIAYFAPPTRLGDAPGESEIVVFDTTSAPVTLRVSGRHLVVSAPNASGARELVEVYEIQNDTIVTALGTAERPAFRVPLPAGARNVRATQGDFTGGAVRVEGSVARVVAPIAPGVRQLVLTYELDAGVFPLALALDLPADVLEVLLEEQTGRVDGGALQAQGPVTVEGRNFARFLGREVPEGAPVSIVVPDSAPSSALPSWVPGVLLGIVSLIVVVLAVRRRSSPTPAAVPAGGPGTWSTAELREAIEGVDQVLASAATAAAARPALEQYRAELEAALARSLASPPSAT